MREGRRISITGTVQGVGFRPWVYRLATGRGLGGWVRNDGPGVTIEVSGTAAGLDAFLNDLRHDPPPAARIRTLAWTSTPAAAATAFAIRSSEQSARREVSIPPDLATCEDCLVDTHDPANRRHGYAFTNCTNCGPRFTIARDVPYDRFATTMAVFSMCGPCQREYDDPASRRFHAQPNACPACGPRLSLADAGGRLIATVDPLAAAAAALCSGQIVALKGLGGFHLACDATDPGAVAALRARKRRDEKPFAVMVANLQAARALVVMTGTEGDLLNSVERPIVLAPRQAHAPVAGNVAPRNPLLGVLLPYTPLHHLMMEAVGRPLVMTSGNLSEEPLASGNDEALARLRGIADLFLLHDRDIETRCDDSVARVIAGRPVVFRRSRGYVPRGLAVISPFARPALGCGALLKNTVCLARDRLAFPGPHIGDLENLETYASYEQTIDRLERFLHIRPEVVAHDLHPHYPSTIYAQQRPGTIAIGVQHHHAHVASAMAEHGLEGPVLGVAYDGAGLGTDGAAWGGEILVADYGRFRRLATFRPLGLAGGDLAIRQVWRLALAALLDAFGGDPPLDRLPLFDAVTRQEQHVVRQMIEQRINTPAAHGVGRCFDAAGAIGLACPESRFEGQVALEWNLIADPGEQKRYDVQMEEADGRLVIDTRPLFRSMVTDLLDGRSPGSVSARFHNTLATATAEVVRAQLFRLGAMPVVLTGGCFQNARLAESVLHAIGPGARVYLHESVPPGDGGLALGQVVVANAVVRAGRRQAAEELCV